MCGGNTHGAKYNPKDRDLLNNGDVDGQDIRIIFNAEDLALRIALGDAPERDA